MPKPLRVSLSVCTPGTGACLSHLPASTSSDGPTSQAGPRALQRSAATDPPVTLLIACPVILPPRVEVLDSWTHRPHLCVINGHHDEWEQVCEERGLLALRSDGNAGCPRSWNLGFEIARDGGIDYVAIMSQSLELEAPGTEMLARCVEELADERGLVTDWSFHAVVFSVALWERIGPFDESLPIYCDIDYAQRLHAAGERTPANPIRAVTLPGRTERAATATAGLIPPDAYEVDRRRYVRKWGAEPCDPCSADQPEVVADKPALVPDLSVEERRGLAQEYLPGGSLGAWPIARTDDHFGTEHASARWTAYLPGVHHHALSSAECDALVAAASRLESKADRLTSLGSHGVRSGAASYVAQVPASDPDAVAATLRVVRAAEAANAEWWRFDLTALEQAQIIRYVAGDEFTPHTDASPLFPFRKLSMIVPLSDPADYDGGALEMMHDGTVTRPPLERGTVIVLPAYLLHRVTPITRGSRCMLVAFLEGPPFR